jgi:hypothetical protein
MMARGSAAVSAAPGRVGEAGGLLWFLPSARAAQRSPWLCWACLSAGRWQCHPCQNRLLLTPGLHQGCSSVLCKAWPPGQERRVQAPSSMHSPAPLGRQPLPGAAVRRGQGPRPRDGLRGAPGVWQDDAGRAAGGAV